MSKLPAHRPSGKQANLPPSLGDTAKMLKVSERSIKNAKKVERQGAPGLIEKVELGKVAVSTAADVAELPKDELHHAHFDVKGVFR